MHERVRGLALAIGRAELDLIGRRDELDLRVAAHGHGAVALLGVSADIKAQLLGDYELPNLHPALAAARRLAARAAGSAAAAPPRSGRGPS